jgi:two-component system response regulator NreC
VLVLTIHREDEYFFKMLEAGASGYVLKGADTSDLINAVRIVSRGEIFLYPAMAQRLVQGYLAQLSRDPDSGPSLSRREKEILKLVAEGFSNKEIAERLVVSLSTIHTHRHNIMGKLRLSTQHELIRYARQHGLISDF